AAVRTFAHAQFVRGQHGFREHGQPLAGSSVCGRHKRLRANRDVSTTRFRAKPALLNSNGAYAAEAWVKSRVQEFVRPAILRSLRVAALNPLNILEDFPERLATR